MDKRTITAEGIEFLEALQNEMLTHCLNGYGLSEAFIAFGIEEVLS